VKLSKGFSLIEIMVAMVLLSMVVLVSTQAYSIFSDKWDGRLGHFNQTLSEAKSLVLVQRAIDGIVPYVVFNEQSQPRLYFEGNRNGFVAVTNTPVFTVGQAAVIRLEAKQLSDFGFELTYQEWSMEDSLLLKTDQELDFGRNIKLFDNQSDILFRYYGWPSAKDKSNAGDIFSKPVTPEWFSDYNSLERGLQPNKISISLSGDNGDREFIYNLSSLESYQLSRYGDGE